MLFYNILDTFCNLYYAIVKLGVVYKIGIISFATSWRSIKPAAILLSVLAGYIISISETFSKRKGSGTPHMDPGQILAQRK